VHAPWRMPATILGSASCTLGSVDLVAQVAHHTTWLQTIGRMRQSHIHNVEKRRLMKLERAMRKESEKSEKMQKREAHQRAQIKRRVCRKIPMHIP
jgi:putative protein kinase ArgK-like GTPase of G3E family